MPVDFGLKVLDACMDTFAINVMVTPYRSQPNAPPFLARGIWTQKTVIEEIAGGGFISSTQPTLGISMHDPAWVVRPMKDDQIQILPGQPIDRVGSGFFTIADTNPDGQEKIDLVLKDNYGG